MATGLATRCSACGTVFRVVPDQLRVSEGWVRCGRCSEVFNAAEALLDLETGARVARVSRAEADMAPIRMPSQAPAPAAMAPAFAEYRVDDGRVDAPAQPGRYQQEQRPDEMPVVDQSASRFAPSALGEDSATSTVADPRADADDKPPPQPSFVRAANRAARWRSAPVRGGMWLVGLLAAVALAAQLVFEYRDLVAARNPALRPLLEAACGWAGCSIGAARSINDVTVESSGLVRVEKSSVYRLSVALRNRAAIDLAMPALELSLTDGQGQLVARRVMQPAELGVNPATVPAGRELLVQATLQAATAPVAGYTLELFYP